MTSPPRLFLLVLLAFAALWLRTPPAAGQPGEESIVLRPGVVIDPGRERIYLMRPEQGCEAVEMAGGEVVWTAAEASKPLALRGERLIVQAERAGAADQIELEVLDPATGEPRAALEIALPPGAWAAIDDGPEAKLTTFATVEDGETVVWWEAEQRQLGALPPTADPGAPGLPPPPGSLPGAAPPGLPPPGDAAEPRVQRFSGASRLELDEGRTEPLGLGTLGPAPRAFLPGAAPPEAPGEDVPEADAGDRFLSADGRHLLASEQIAGDDEWEKYRWTIFDRETDQELGAITSHFAIAPFWVQGTTIYYETPPFVRFVDGQPIEEPLQLRAADLREGVELWARPIRDTAYRGPFPP